MITVVRQPPPKKVPLDPLRVHVQGISETTTIDCLSFYLEKFAGVEVEKVYLGEKNNALAVFESETDFESLLHKVNKDKKGLEGKKPRLERVAVCSCILVTGLKKESTDHTIELYFDNEKRSGGKDVCRVERIRKDQALVFFEDHTSVQDVIVRSQRQAHKIDGVELEVTPYYPFLKNAASKTTEMKFDPDTYQYIRVHHKIELQTSLEKYSVEAELSDGSILIISPTETKCDPSWEEGAESCKNFLLSFKKSEVPVPSEIYDEVSKRWQGQTPSQGTANFLLSFDNHRRQAVILGKEALVEKEEEKLKKLITDVKENSELMKTVVEVVETNYTKSRLTLLEMSGLCNKLSDKHRHLSINIDSTGEKLCFKGPRKNIQEVKLEVVTFISKVIERTTEQPTGIIDVLRQQHVSKFIQELFEKKSIQAVILLDQGRSSNEVQVVGVNEKNAKEAKVILEDSLKEKSIHLKPENAQVINGREWKDFKSSLTSELKVGIAVDASVSNVWISGILEDVEQCSDQMQKFLEMKTIFHKVIQVEEGTGRFISTFWKKKLEAVKGELSNCYVDMRVTSDYMGIEVSGTTEGMAKCIPEIHDLIDAVQKECMTVNKPGMKKFFEDVKGKSILKSVEDASKCVILTSENNEVQNVPDFTREEHMAAEFFCSFSTKHGKTISVMKGDITKDPVDAIVNAANERLQHIGGVAYAIVKEGGREIKDECDTFIKQNGPLLDGHVFVSTAGSLPCNQVIHAVGPRWDKGKRREVEVTQEERYLKQAIINVLAEAKHLTSLAIAGVSCGIFDFPRDLFAKIILDTVLAFWEKDSNCRLSEIHLIDKDDQTVKAFEGELRRFSDQQTFHPRKVGKSDFGSEESHSGNARTGQVRTARAPRSFVTQGIRVTVKSGYLADEQADILVGTAASNLSLSQNPCARALSQRAGPALQRECDNRGHVAVGDIAVVDQPGNLKCQAVFFAVCSEWESGKGKKVLKKIIRKCLEEATRAGMASIAFPAIGTGILAFPRTEVAEIYFDEVTSHNKKKPVNYT
ncbi:poly [ADP-ribose] polymerase 14-like [Stylophora pistillata]|uniref:poly [ADP-ribose] polymerase 14-like n=1 Tax=Stylophora pistillata TaxID=50429 RepID=UPI000C051CC5|nr:poly [ADP-ribose] polymerase 14-like [Stylophora pistillata]